MASLLTNRDSIVFTTIHLFNIRGLCILFNSIELDILHGPLSVQTPFKVGTSSLKRIMNPFSQLIDQKHNKH